jgi:hypothetical protein
MKREQEEEVEKMVQDNDKIFQPFYLYVFVSLLSSH